MRRLSRLQRSTALVPIVVGACVFWTALPPAPAAPPAEGAVLRARSEPGEPGRDPLTAPEREAVAKALKFIRAELRRPAKDWAAVAGTDAELDAHSLAGLAFLAAGVDTDAEDLRRCVRFVLARSHPGVGRIAALEPRRGMASHALATLFLAAEFKRFQSDAVADALRKGVRFIEQQQRQDGGWQEGIFRTERGLTWAALTAEQLDALQAARLAGVDVDPAVVGRGLAFLRKCQSEESGGFEYVPENDNGAGISDTTPRCVVALAVAGDLEAAKRGVAYVLKERVQIDTGRISLLRQFYSCRALQTAPGAPSRERAGATRRELAKTQRIDGSWPEESAAGPARVSATAVAALTIQLADDHTGVLVPRWDEPRNQGRDGEGE